MNLKLPSPSSIRRPANALAPALYLVAGILLLAGCAGEPTIQRGEDAEVVLGRLNRVDNARVDFAYVDPAIDFRRYGKLQLLPLDLDHVAIVQPGSSNSVMSRIDTEWELTDEDRSRIRDVYREAMEKAIGGSATVTLSDRPGPEVLAVEAVLTRIAPNAPKDDTRSRPIGRTRVYTEGAGSMSIALALVDSESGEVLALMKDTRDGEGGMWGLNNSVSNMAEVRRIFGIWGRLLAGGLDRITRAPAQGTPS